MARVREARLKNGEKGPPSGIQIFLQGALAKLGATLVCPGMQSQRHLWSGGLHIVPHALTSCLASLALLVEHDCKS